MRSKVLTVLLSASIAFALWLYVITVERTQIEYTFYNVPVVMDGESVLQDRGLMIASDTEQTVDLTLSGKRSDLNKLKSSDITVLVDLTRIYEAGERTLSYEVSFPGDVQNSAIEIVKRQPDSIQLTIAQWETKDIPVQINPVGTPAEDFKIDTANLSVTPQSVNISGPKNLIDRIAMGKITVDMEGAKESYEQRHRIVLCDSDGVAVDEDLSNVFVENHLILVKIPVLMEKEIRLRLPIIPGGGLKAEDVTLDMSLEKITVSGSPSVIAKMADVIELEPIDLSKVMESFTNREYTFTLPKGVKSEEGTTVIVSLLLPQMETRTVEVPLSQIQVIGVPEGYVATPAGKLEVTVRGKALAFAGFKTSDIRVTVDLNGATTRGNYPAQIVVGNGSDIVAVEDSENGYKVYILLTQQGA